MVSTDVLQLAAVNPLIGSTSLETLENLSRSVRFIMRILEQDHVVSLSSGLDLYVATCLAAINYELRRSHSR